MSEGGNGVKSHAGRQEQEETNLPGGGPSTGERPARAASRAGAEVPAGWGRYLVAPRPLGLLPGVVPPIEASVLQALLSEDDEVRVLNQLRPSRSRGLGAIAEPTPTCPPITVVAMPPERARALAANPQVVVEPDQPLLYASVNPLAAAVPAADPALAVALAEPATLTVRVQDSDETPVVGAHVWAIGSTAPAYAVTGIAGRATLMLPADTSETVRALYVRPVGGFWPTRLEGTGLPQNGQAEVVVTVRALSEDFEGFPGTPITGWGAQAMRLNQIPPTFRGHGTAIALFDSGIYADHPDLKDTITAGHDFTTGSHTGWERDATGHGTSCAGVIAAADNHTGIRGIAADTRLHALKLYPNGRISHLIQALDWCVTHDIDLAQINLVCAQPSQLVAWKVLDARAAGTTCIAPGGDTGATAAFPATLPTVLSVGALAHTSTFPEHLRAPHDAWQGPYLPPFTPAGTDLIAPGTAIITTSPDGDYTPANGTALAAAHVTALAALLLAHHDQLRAPMYPRTHARVDHLTTLLRAASRPVAGTDPARTGAGLPDAPIALGLTTPSWQANPHTLTTTSSHPQYAHPGA